VAKFYKLDKLLYSLMLRIIIYNFIFIDISIMSLLQKEILCNV